MMSIGFGECVFRDMIGETIGYLVLLPVAVLIVSMGSSIVFRMDIALFLFNNTILLFVWWFSGFLAIICQVERPRSAVECGVRGYALVDAAFVPLVVFFIVLFCVGLTRKTNIRTSSTIFFLVLVVLYTFAIWYDEHMNLEHLLLNLSLSFGFSSFSFWFYMNMFIPVEDRYKKSKIFHWLGLSNTLSRNYNI